MQPLEQVARRLKGLIIKRPGMVFGLWGEAGIGKTHCATQLLRESQCKNISLHATTALSNLARALPKPKTLPIWTTRILEKLELGEALSIEQTTSTFGAVLSGIAPFVLHLEDVHEASLERLEWIVAMAKVVTRLKGVALVVTSRTHPPEPFEAIRLEKLDFEAVKTLLETEARSILPLEALEWIHGKAAGNPLFTLEFFRFLTRQGFVWTDGQKWRWRTPEHEIMPVTVEALLQEMLEQALTNPIFMDVIVVKTMLPRGSSLELWSNTVGISQVNFEYVRTELSKFGVLINDEFAHPLFGEVVGQNISFEKKKTFARKALNFLDNNPLFAVPLIKDAELHRAESQQWMERSAAQAESLGNASLACDLRIQALDYYDPADRLRKGLKLAHDVKTFSLLKASILFERFNSQFPNDVFVRAEVLALLGRFSEAERLLNEMSISHTEQIWLEHFLMIHSDAEDNNGVVTLWNRHEQLHLSINPRFLYKVAQSLIQVSRFQDAARLLEVALQKLPSLELKADLFVSKGILEHFFGNSDLSEHYYTQAKAIYESTKNIFGLGCVFYRLGVLNYYQASLSEAVVFLQKSMKLFAELGHQAQSLQSQVMLGASHTELGQFQQAEIDLLEVEEQLGKTSFHSIWIQACTSLSFLYRGWDVPYGTVLALRFSQAALQVAREINNPRLVANCLYHASKSETFAQNPYTGLQLADDCLELATELDYPAMLAYSNHARYQALLALGRRDEALIALRTAEVKTRFQGSINDADFYAIEIECLTGNLETSRVQLNTMIKKENFLYADLALRAFPELELETHAAIEVSYLSLTTLGLIQIEGNLIRGRKRQELLLLLLEARVTGKSELTRLEFFDALYPNDPEDRAASSLKELIRGTRASLGADVIQTTQNGYAIGQVTSDIEEFFKTGDSSLWRGAYLQGLGFSGSKNVRESLELALQNCIQKLLETNSKEAARVSRILLEMNPYDLEILRLCILAFKACENYKTLGRVYNEARTRFADLGEILPERWQDFLEILKPA